MITALIYSYRNIFLMHVTLYVVAIVNFMATISLKFQNIRFHQILVKHGTHSLYRLFQISSRLARPLQRDFRVKEVARNILVNLKGSCGALSYRNAIISECIR